MTRHVVVTTIERADPATIRGLGEAGVATIHEAAGQTGLFDAGIRPIQEGAAIAGSAVTVSCGPGDNIMIHAAVEVIEPGDVLVVGTTSPSTHGMFGDLLASSVMRRECRGLVIDAGVRDVADLRSMGFPVWSRVIHAEGTTKVTPGSVNIPIVCAGVAVSPGDVVVADDDGVVLVARHRAEEVLDAARRRLEREEETRARLGKGDLGLDLYGFRERLGEMGVRWVDAPDE